MLSPKKRADFMFGFLKKKIKEVIEKVSKKTEETIIEKPEIKPREENLSTAKEEPKIEEIYPDKEAEKQIYELEKIEEREDKLSKEKKAEFEEKKEAYEEIKKEIPEIKSVEDILKDIEEEETKESVISVEKKPIDEIIKETRKEELREAIEKESIKEEPEDKKGFFRQLTKKVVEKKLTEDEIEGILKELKTALLENDVAFEVAERVCDDVKAELIGSSVRRGKTEETIKKALYSAIIGITKQEEININEKIASSSGPCLIMFIGFNGVGKTTTLAKMAHKFKNYNPILAAGDTFRAASIEQLEEHCRRLGTRLIKHKYGADSAAVIFDAKKHAAASSSKLVLADTAGRSHSNVNLMDELKKVVRVNKPDLKVLVLDSLTGNDIYNQAKMFDEAVGIDAIILTKADVYEKGGAALSASFVLKKPILYLGVGQNYDDLVEFVPEKIAKEMVGM